VFRTHPYLGVEEHSTLAKEFNLVKKRLKKIVLLIVGVLILTVIVLFTVNTWLTGRPIDSYRGVEVIYNGFLYSRSYGKSYSSDGYYYGQKWQCVEFIKRFYFDALEHRMPDVMGHAKDFYDPDIFHRGYNSRRDMIQFQNGGDESPAIDDLLVFRDTGYGHVAIVIAVSAEEIEVIQQNIIGRSRQTFTLQRINGNYTISAPKSPAGWLRVKRGKNG
jgi:hypothetical protein